MKCLHFKVTLIFVKDTMYCCFFIVKRCYMFAIFYIKRYFCGTMTNNLFEFI